jgi:hypothetical protein
MRFNASHQDEFSSAREGHVMNGTSLAALLGAATWFGSKVHGEEDDADEKVGLAGDASLSVDLAEEIETRENEFLWPSGPMFQ